jgi:hypothetical protein
MFAGDNKGKLPISQVGGSTNRAHPHGTYGNTYQNSFYDMWWGNAEGTTTKRKRKGKYLDNHMVLYCPGLQRQDVGQLWWYWDGSAYPARNFDRLFCIEDAGRPNNASSGGCRAPIGYTLMLGSWEDNECPKRAATDYKPLSTSSKPVCWLATDLYSTNGDHKFDWWSHRPGDENNLKYNVIHVDGHADTHKASRFVGWSDSNVGGGWQYSPWSSSHYSYYDTDDDR